MLSEYVARYVAVAGLGYNLLGEASALTRREIESRINIHLFRMEMIEKIISNPDFVNYVSDSNA